MNNKRNGLKIDRPREWRAISAILVMGLLIFETLTGLAIYLLPFSLSIQFMVLVHTAAGLIFIFPYTWYQIRHWLVYRRQTMTHVKMTGYLSLVATLVCGVSGIVLTFQALFATRISYVWDTTHIVSTFALIAFALPHVFTLLLRNWRLKDNERVAQVVAAVRVFGWGSLGVAVALFAVTALWMYAYEPVEFRNDFPQDYNFTHGEDRPFMPSLAQTSTGGALDDRSLSGSRSCGTSGCHEEILKEWEPSAHRYSAMDAAFQKVQSVMAEQNGPESTRYCGGCHDPISLFSGTKNIFVDDLTSLAGHQEGISCLVCHAIKETDVKGNAAYTIVQPERYAYELKEGETARYLRDFLIRSYPKQHVESLSHRLFKSPEFCAACHKQFIDEEINKVGWVQLQNQFDNWRKSRWNTEGDPSKTIECRECHMPLVADSKEPASGDALDYNRSSKDKKHRSHRFLGANQFMPLLHELPDAELHTDLVKQWLRGEIEIPEIADKWSQGPAVPIELQVPEQVAAGEQVEIQVVITNNKVGHDFPTGPLDIIQAWLEVVVKDNEGNVVYNSGTRDDNHFIEPGSFIFKAEAVDQYGNLIDRHNLWEMVGVRYKRTLFPGFSDVAEYAFDCPVALRSSETELPKGESFQFSAPPTGSGMLHVEARLQYRKIDQYLLTFLYGEETELTSPVTTISEATGRIKIVQAQVRSD
ncbi:MAG: multiheme c-type cytochrome [Candidatus Krumholzibacteria bacterium]